MDLETGQVLTEGLMDLVTPETEIPEDREGIGYDIYDPLGAEELIEHLEAGRVIDCAEYYGIPHIWKAEDDYRGTLLQWRKVSEAPHFSSAEEAIDWFIETAWEVLG